MSRVYIIYSTYRSIASNEHLRLHKNFNLIQNLIKIKVSFKIMYHTIKRLTRSGKCSVISIVLEIV